MIQRWPARLCLIAAAMTIAKYSNAGVWGIDPVLGVTGDYATNPLLNNVGVMSEANGAVLLDAPTTYNAAAFKFSLLPSFRVGNSEGYSSVTSDYEHLNAKGEFDTERSVMTANIGVARDSSLYQDYLTNGAMGVRRDSATADMNWDRKITENIDLDTDINSIRVRYGETTGAGTLVDYKYTSIAPTLSWSSSDRNKFTFLATIGRYNALDGTTESRSANLQFGFVRQLSELWSVTVSGGYSRALDRIETAEEVLVLTPFGLAYEIIPINTSSTQNGTVYSVNLSHQGSLLLLNAIASRQVTPSGFALLARQDTYELKGTYSLSARWSLNGDLREVEYQNPQYNGLLTSVKVGYLDLTASWQWTEKWTASMSISHVTEKVQLPSYDVASNEVTITLSRQFNHISFQ
jgi:hypothetical protein